MEICAQCGFDPRRLSPTDASVAARTFPRRYASAIVRRDDEESADALVRRRPPEGGRSALELVADTAAAIEARTDDLRRILISDDAAVGGPPPEGEPGSVDDTLARLEVASTRLAEVIDRGQGKDWTRTATAPQGTITALEMAADAVHQGVHRLREIDAVLRAVRGRPS